MREFKFRAWDKVNKEMLIVSQLWEAGILDSYKYFHPMEDIELLEWTAHIVKRKL